MGPEKQAGHAQGTLHTEVWERVWGTGRGARRPEDRAGAPRAAQPVCVWTPRVETWVTTTASTLQQELGQRGAG